MPGPVLPPINPERRSINPAARVGWALALGAMMAGAILRAGRYLVAEARRAFRLAAVGRDGDGGYDGT